MGFIERLRRQKEAAELPSRVQREAELSRKSEAEEAARQQTAKNRLVLEKHHVNDRLGAYRDIAWNGHGTISPVKRDSSVPEVQELELIGFELFGYKAINAQLLNAEVRTMLPMGDRRTGDYDPGGRSYISGWRPATDDLGRVITGLIAERHAIRVVVESIDSDFEIFVSSYSELTTKKDKYTFAYAKYVPMNAYHPYGTYSLAIGVNGNLEDFLASNFQKRLSAGQIPDFGTVEELGWFEYHSRNKWPGPLLGKE